VLGWCLLNDNDDGGPVGEFASVLIWISSWWLYLFLLCR
jgi:hypothetical protein